MNPHAGDERLVRRHETDVGATDRAPVDRGHGQRAVVAGQPVVDHALDVVAILAAPRRAAERDDGAAVFGNGPPHDAGRICSIGLHDSQRYHKPDWPMAPAAARRHRHARS